MDRSGGTLAGKINTGERGDPPRTEDLPGPDSGPTGRGQAARSTMPWPGQSWGGIGQTGLSETKKTPLAHSAPCKVIPMRGSRHPCNLSSAFCLVWATRLVDW